MIKGLSRAFVTGFIRVSALLVLVAVAGVAPPAKGAEPLLRMGFTQDVFGNVSLKDAEIAVQYWVELLATEMGEAYQGQSKIFPFPQELFQSVRAQPFDLVSTPPVDYLRASSSVSLEPILASTLHGKHMTRFQLLVRKDSPFADLKSLKGKTVIFQTYGCGDALEMWLDIELKKIGAGPAQTFFGKILEVKEASKVVLPVFFKQAHGCVMLDGSFDVVSEMNPQLKKQLSVLRESQDFLGGVVLFPRDMDGEKKRTLKKICLRMSTYPKGMQILTLFRIDNLIEFPSGALDSLEQLLREHETLFPR